MELLQFLLSLLTHLLFFLINSEFHIFYTQARSIKGGGQGGPAPPPDATCLNLKKNIAERKKCVLVLGGGGWDSPSPRSF